MREPHGFSLISSASIGLRRKTREFVPGPTTNIQFMVKDSTKYAATGGWGFGHFGTDGKPGDAAFMKSCFPCHEKATATDLVFTRYAP